MPIIVENKLITLNSLYGAKQNGTLNSNVLFNFKGVLTDEDDIISSNICVMNAQIPVSFYVVTVNSTIEALDLSTGIGTVYIPAGNYNFNSLKVLVDTQYAAANVPIELLLDKATGKVTFYLINTSNAPNRIRFTPASLSKIMGYGGVLTILPTGGGSFAASYPMNVLGVKKLNIQSQKLQISSFTSATNNLGVTLCTIPVDQPAHGMISYTNQTDLNKAALQTKVIDQIDIGITDEDNNLLDFHNIDWSITLVLENIRHIPEKFTTPFRELTSPVDGFSDKVASSDQTINDIKDLELLSA